MRLRPALDLLAQVPDVPPGDVIDLGCGAGAVGPALRDRFPDRKLIGVDSSQAMLDRAAQTGVYDALIMADASDWVPDAPPALLYSNAALQWLGAHEQLMPHLAGLLGPGGVLAVQMPRQQEAPSHALLRRVAADLFPDLFDFSDYQSPTHAPELYHQVLSQMGQLSLWETSYFQTMQADSAEHPVRAFTQSTAMRPISEKLDDAQTARFLKAYDEAMAAAYPPGPDGQVLFPFRRLFFVLRT